MDLSKYTEQGKRWAAYITNRPDLYKPLIWILNKAALIVGFFLIPRKLYNDWKNK